MFAAAVPLPALLLRRGGLAAQSSSKAAAPAEGMQVREAVRTQTFWTILACFFLQSAALNGCVAHLAPMLTDGGLTTANAALAASILGGSTMAGRLTTGWMLDRFFAPRVAAAFFGMATVGVLVLLLPTTQAAALGASALIGFSMGAEADAMPYLVSRYFGLRSFTELFGYTFSAYAVAGALGPGLMGLGFDHFGDYRMTIVGLALTITAGTLLMFRLPRFDETAAQPLEEDLNHATHPAS